MTFLGNGRSVSHLLLVGFFENLPTSSRQDFLNEVLEKPARLSWIVHNSMLIPEQSHLHPLLVFFSKQS